MDSGSDDLFDDSSSGSNKQFTFTIENGEVVAYFEVENGIVEQESIDRNDLFVIDGDQITLTEQTSNGPEVTVFSDSDGDGFYTIVFDSNDDSVSNDDSGDDDSSGGGHKAYKFDIANGEVVAVFELDDGVFEPEPIDDDGSEIYTIEGTEVVRTDLEAFGTEITRYADEDGYGIYFRVSEQWLPSSDAPAGSTMPQLTEALRYSPTDGDDFIAVRGGDNSQGGLGADSFVIREAAHLRIEDFKSSDDDFLIFDTGRGLTSKEQLTSFITDIHHDGHDLFFEFGAHVSITLVGVQPSDISWDDVSILS